jgi:hypothetical protein
MQPQLVGIKAFATFLARNLKTSGSRYGSESERVNKMLAFSGAVIFRYSVSMML